MDHHAPSSSSKWAVPAAGALLLVVIGAGVLRLGWGAWLDVLVDFGRELYVPWRLSDGEVLYRDVAYFNGPLSPYLNSLWFRAFGVSLTTLTWCNIAILGTFVALSYRVLRVWANHLAATAACAVFLLVFACAQYTPLGNYNWVTPYSHEITHGLCLSVAAILCLVRAARGASRGWAAGAGALTGLVFLTKAEVFLALVVAMLVGLVAVARGSRTPGAPRLVAAWTGAALVPPLIAFLALVAAMPAGEALRGACGSWPYLLSTDAGSQPFYRTMLGLDEPGANVAAIGRWSLAYGLTFGALVGLALLARFVRAPRGLLAAVAFVVALVALGPFRDRIGWFLAARPWPVLLGLCAGVGTLQALRGARANFEGEAGARALGNLALCTFAVVLLLKMGLKPRVHFYGFALAAPAAMWLTAAALAPVPSWIARRGGNAGVWCGGVLGLLAVALPFYVTTSVRYFGESTNTVGSGADEFRGSLRAPFVSRALRAIEGELEEGAAFVVLPEGVILNYLARRPSSTPYVNLMPPELLFFGEDRILAALQASAPPMIVLVHKNTSEYGYPLFGTDYGQSILAWVRRDYEQLRLFGAVPLRDKRFGIQVLVRRPRDE